MYRFVQHCSSDVEQAQPHCRRAHPNWNISMAILNTHEFVLTYNMKCTRRFEEFGEVFEIFPGAFSKLRMSMFSNWLEQKVNNIRILASLSEGQLFVKPCMCKNSILAQIYADENLWPRNIFFRLRRFFWSTQENRIRSAAPMSIYLPVQWYTTKFGVFLADELIFITLFF